MLNLKKLAAMPSRLPGAMASTFRSVRDSGVGSFVLLLCANAILVTALPMMIVLAGLAGLLLAPGPELATLPASVSTLAGLCAAAPFSLFMGRHGRQAGFILGAICAAAGGLAGVAAMDQGSFLLLLTAHFLLGAALTCFQFFRFAAGEVVPNQWQSVAISLVLTSGLIAALLGPEVFARTQNALAPTPLAGAYGAITALSLIGTLPLIFLRGLARPQANADKPLSRGDVMRVVRRPTVSLAIITATISQGVMVLLMVPTPIVMVGCGFSSDTAGDVIGWHVVAMFAPSFVTGFLIKRFGAAAIIYAGLALMAMVSLVAASGLTLTHFYGALIILGTGWNLSFIGATSLLADALAPAERAAVQAVNDTALALASAAAALASGAVVAGFGWATLALAALPIILGMAVVLLRFQRRQRTASV